MKTQHTASRSTNLLSHVRNDYMRARLLLATYLFHDGLGHAREGLFEQRFPDRLLGFLRLLRRLFYQAHDGEISPVSFFKFTRNLNLTFGGNDFKFLT